jgi:hypothetical protein
MQLSAHEALELSQETEQTQKMYGIGQGVTDSYGRRCLIARRLIERGVRFVQLYHGGGGQGWDTHGSSDSRHVQNGQQIDKPIAGRSPT